MKQSGGIPSEGDKRDRKGIAMILLHYIRLEECQDECYLAPEPASGTRPRGILPTYVTTVFDPTDGGVRIG